jgi:hypothetical protein
MAISEFNITTLTEIGNITTAPTNGKHLQLNVGNKTEIGSHIKPAGYLPKI